MQHGAPAHWFEGDVDAEDFRRDGGRNGIENGEIEIPVYRRDALAARVALPNFVVRDAARTHGRFERFAIGSGDARRPSGVAQSMNAPSQALGEKLEFGY